MAIEIPAGYIEVSPGVYERPTVPNRSKRANPQPKRAVRNEPLGQSKGKKADSKRVHIRITVYRKRLIDPDNSCCKWHIDCLRYAGLISDDREQDITIETRQEKAKEEKTVIELFTGTGENHKSDSPSP
jgi:hypothetical protein